MRDRTIENRLCDNLIYYHKIFEGLLFILVFVETLIIKINFLPSVFFGAMVVYERKGKGSTTAGMTITKNHATWLIAKMVS